jgi:hypothetical protein
MPSGLGKALVKEVVKRSKKENTSLLKSEKPTRDFSDVHQSIKSVLKKT